MRILVLGAGVIGVTSAYYLARAGFEVTVIDRQSAVAQETSFANAGQISPGYASPWAAPGMPIKALRWLVQKHSPLKWRPDGSFWQWLWLLAWLRNCTAARYADNKRSMVQLAEYSRDCLRELRVEEQMVYEARTLGTLQVFRFQQQWQAAQKDIRVLEQCGIPHRLLNRDACAEIEPAWVKTSAPIVGGLHLPGDETGDCQQFTVALAEKARRLGVCFRFGQTAETLQTEPHRVVVTMTGGEMLEAERVVVAAGSYSRDLLLPLGMRLPVYPVKGYSLTAAMINESKAPVSTVLDETYKVAITRFDRRIRVGGMAELVGFDLRLDYRRRATLAMVTDSLFPGSCDLPQASFWAGLRPMTPRGLPLIGATRHANVWLNTGHGTLGWTMACGSARMLADCMAGRKPEIPEMAFMPEFV